MAHSAPMATRTYLVVIDESAEAALALRFAARRAARTGGSLAIVAIVEEEDFVAWADVQATIAQEARARAEALVTGAAGSIVQETGLRPSIVVRQGEPVRVLRELLEQLPEVAALVLGAAAEGKPGPLVEHFTGSTGLGSLPCPLIVVPGALSPEALDRLS